MFMLASTQMDCNNYGLHFQPQTRDRISAIHFIGMLRNYPTWQILLAEPQADFELSYCSYLTCSQAHINFICTLVFSSPASGYSNLCSKYLACRLGMRLGPRPSSACITVRKKVSQRKSAVACHLPFQLIILFVTTRPLLLLGSMNALTLNQHEPCSYQLVIQAIVLACQYSRATMFKNESRIQSILQSMVQSMVQSRVQSSPESSFYIDPYSPQAAATQDVNQGLSSSQELQFGTKKKLLGGSETKLWVLLFWQYTPLKPFHLPCLAAYILYGKPQASFVVQSHRTAAKYTPICIYCSDMSQRTHIHSALLVLRSP